MLHGEDAEKHFKLHKKILSRIRNVTVFVYLFIVPYLESPDWCLRYFKSDDTPSVDGIFVPCQEACGGIILYSNLPKLIPVVSSSLDILCLTGMCIFRFQKGSWRKL